jgi:hypothetical protein
MNGNPIATARLHRAIKKLTKPHDTIMREQGVHSIQREEAVTNFSYMTLNGSHYLTSNGKPYL